MQKTLDRYRGLIRSGQVNPVRRWDGATAAVLDCNDDAVPLSVLSMDGFALGGEAIDVETAGREWLVMPIDGTLAVAVGGETFTCERSGGPFAAWPGGCNASAVYLPRNASATLSGQGEAIGFSAPAFDDRPAVRVEASGARGIVARGSGIWRRDVATLATPADVTTNLVMGETYSPPGLWSGTPLHVHDRPDATEGQSDHEEIYYHLARNVGGDWGPFGVQMLFDDAGLDEAYVLHDRTAFAIPGAAHPVIAGPNCEMMCVWCLAAETSQSLGMKDVPEFAWLKRVGAVLDDLSASGRRELLSDDEIAALAKDAGLDEAQRRVLQFHLARAGLAAEPGA